MAIFALTYGCCSPGVTTLGVALTLSWPRPVTLVEADPTGGSGILAGYFRGMVDHPGLIDLVMAHRQGRLASALPSVLLPVPDTNAHILVGSRAHEQSVGLTELWDPLLPVLRDLAATGQDVIVDAGRLGLDGSPSPLVFGADVTALVSRSSLPALAGARSWAATLRERAAAAGCVLVGEGRPYRAGEVRRVLGLPMFGSVAWDPQAAEVFSEGAPYPGRGLVGGGAAAKRRFARSAWYRSVLALGESLRSRATLALDGDLVAFTGGAR